MVPSGATWALALLVLAKGLQAHRFDWVDTLPDCWKECLDDTKDGCDSSKCICDASQSDNYLPPAVQCAATTCEAADWALAVTFIMPLQAYCGAVGNSIPDEMISSAYAVVTAIETLQPEPASTRKVEHSEKSESPKTTKKGGNQLTEVFTSTMTKLITDGDGNTLQIVVPVILGPNTMSFGKTVTSTLEEETSTTDSPSSPAASPSSTPEATIPTSNQAQQQPQAASSTTSSQTAQKTSNSNGSPFENMQAGAGRFEVSALIAALGAAAGIFFTL